MNKFFKLVSAGTLALAFLATGMSYNKINAVEDTAVRYSSTCYSSSSQALSWSYTDSLNTAFDAIKSTGGTVEVLKDLSTNTSITLNTTAKDYVLMSENGSTITWTGTSSGSCLIDCEASSISVLGNVVMTSTSTVSRCFDVMNGAVYFGIEKSTASTIIANQALGDYKEPDVAPTITGFNSEILGSAMCAGKDSAIVCIGGGVIEKCGANDPDGTYSKGGAIWVTGAFYMFGGTLRDNAAKNGGAVYIGDSKWGQKATALMLGGTICENTSATSGAAIYVEIGTVNLLGGTITSNLVNSTGDAVVVNNGTVTIGNCMIYENIKDGVVDETCNVSSTGTVKYTSDIYETTDGVTKVKDSVIASQDVADIKELSAVASLSYTASFDDDGNYYFTNVGANDTVRSGVGLRMGLQIPYKSSTRIAKYGIEYTGTDGTTKTQEKTTKVYRCLDGLTVPTSSTLSSDTLLVMYIKFNVTDFTKEYTVKPYVVMNDDAATKVYLNAKTASVQDIAKTYLEITGNATIQAVNGSLTYLSENATNPVPVFHTEDVTTTQEAE